MDYVWKPFTEKDLALAKLFAQKAKLSGDIKPEFWNTEQDRDTIILGGFSITRVAGTKERHSVLGTRLLPCDEYIVDAASTTYSHISGYDTDYVEVGRAYTLFDALKICAHAELDWALDGMEFPELATEPEEQF